MVHPVREDPAALGAHPGRALCARRREAARGQPEVVEVVEEALKGHRVCFCYRSMHGGIFLVSDFLRSSFDPMKKPHLIL